MSFTTMSRPLFGFLNEHHGPLSIGLAPNSFCASAQGLKIACPEEIAYRMGYIDAARLEQLGNALARNGYGRYLLGLLRDPVVR